MFIDNVKLLFFFFFFSLHRSALSISWICGNISIIVQLNLIPEVSPIISDSLSPFCTRWWNPKWPTDLPTSSDKYWYKLLRITAMILENSGHWNVVQISPYFNGHIVLTEVRTFLHYIHPINMYWSHQNKKTSRVCSNVPNDPWPLTWWPVVWVVMITSPITAVLSVLVAPSQ